MRRHYLFLAILTFVVVTPVLAAAQIQIPIDLREKIDNLIQDSLTRTGVPSRSVALVKDGQVAYVKAYGDARIDPRTPATPEMRYSIGSISKQFTAAAILLLKEEGKLSLDDKVGKFVPGLTRGNEVTIRQLLSHTSGYQDYWPQDYLFPMMLEPVKAERILDLWAQRQSWAGVRLISKTQQELRSAEERVSLSALAVTQFAVSSSFSFCSARTCSSSVLTRSLKRAKCAS